MYKDDLTVTAEAPVTRSWWIAAVAAIWLASAVAGLWVLWSYENRPGAPAQTPAQWPAATAFRLAENRPTLVFLAHPQLFSGGITAARGHAGDNEGRGAVVSLLDHLETRHRTTNVFGCSLFAAAKS